MNFAAEIDDARIQALAPAIAKQLADEPAKRDLLARFALDQILAWLAGQTAYQSLTDMQADWLMQLLPAFYPNEAPSPERLSNDFNIPYGRAAYLARVLLDRSKARWREIGRQHLHDAIKAKLPEARANQKFPDKTVPVLLDAGAYRAWRTTLGTFDLSESLLQYVTTKAAGPIHRLVGIPAGLFDTILARLET